MAVSIWLRRIWRTQGPQPSVAVTGSLGELGLGASITPHLVCSDIDDEPSGSNSTSLMTRPKESIEHRL